MNMLGLSSSIYIAHITYYLNCIILHYIQVLLSVQASRSGSCLADIYYDTTTAWTVINLTTAKFKRLIFLTELGRASNVASDRTTQKTPPPTVLAFLRVGRCLETAAVSFHGRCLEAGIYAIVSCSCGRFETPVLHTVKLEYWLDGHTWWSLRPPGSSGPQS
jgi:hypothetical protein